MELQAIQFLLLVGDAGTKHAASRDGAEAIRNLVHAVPVGEKHALRLVHPSKQGAIGHHLDLFLTVLALVLGLHGALEVMVKHLHSVADPKNWQATREDGLVVLGCVCGIGTPRSTADDQCGVPVANELRRRRPKGHDLAENLQLPNSSIDHLSVLCPRVQDRDAVLDWIRCNGLRVATSLGTLRGSCRHSDRCGRHLNLSYNK
mmetsp:Transcript_94212/g.266044  ORF Transcript_94212/g.266044 Transcript_94212/m.266044 type:complete len:204 (-) Transcript_94212:21-632(-)